MVKKGSHKAICKNGHPQVEGTFWVSPARGNTQVCIACDKERKEVASEKHRDTTLKRLYGISLDEVREMRDVQEGCCAICFREISEELKNMVVDHNHETGEVRGLLCRGCNSSLGHFQDKPQILQNAVSYLERSRPEYQI